MQTLTQPQPTSSPVLFMSRSIFHHYPSIQSRFDDDHSLMFSSVQVNDGNELIASAVTAISVRIVISNGNIPLLLISISQLGQETTLVTSGGGVAFTVSRPHPTIPLNMHLIKACRPLPRETPVS